MFNKFCFCCTLRQGCFTIAYCYLVFLTSFLVKEFVQRSYYDNESIEIIVGVFVEMVLCFILAYGTHKEKWTYLVPWLVSQLITHTTFTIYAFIFSNMEPYILVGLPFVLFGYYLCFVVYSYIMELRRNKKLMQPINVAKQPESPTIIINPIWNENYIPPPPPPPYSKTDQNSVNNQQKTTQVQ